MSLTFARARVRFFPPTNGGRHTMPLGDGYAPYFRLLESSQDLAVRIYGMPERDAKFDTPYDVEVELAYHPMLDYSALQPGTTISIVEGPKIVGEGEIVSSWYTRTQ